MDCLQGEDEKILCTAFQDTDDLIKVKNKHISSEICDGFLCSTGKCIALEKVDDFLPDCEEGDDETLYKSLLMQEQEIRADSCNNPNFLPCIPGHTRCFPRDKLCLYERNIKGQIMYCPNGNHLWDCKYHRCTNSYKCPDSH